MQIIFGTCIAIGEVSYVTNERAKGFPLVVMNEGAMCTEMSSIVPLVEGAEWLCAASDLNQLRPVVTSRRAKQLLTYTMNTPKAYGGSLFGRWVALVQ